MGMIKEFREFVNQGNAFDLAVGVVIGAGFGKIVNSIVNDLVMPVVSLITSGVRLQDLFIPLRGAPPEVPDALTTLEKARGAGVPVIAYGQFINVVVEFFIIAIAVFLVIRQINKWRSSSGTVVANQ